MPIRMEVERNDLPQIAAGAREKANAVILKAANDVVAYSAPFTPVKTGFLLNSAGVTMGDLEAWARWTAEYARYQHDGTRYISAKRFASQGAEMVRPGYIAAMKTIFQL